MNSLAHCHLYGIVDLDYITPPQVEGMTQLLIRGGVDILQLRAKQRAAEQIVDYGRRMRTITASAGVPLIINDHPELVGPIGAEGAHIGQDDGPIAEARALAGPNALIGRSTHSVDQARSGFAEGADYIGFGPLFSTPTKPDYPPIGLEEIRLVHSEATIPVFCIGGIKLENLRQVQAAGACRVVIVSGLLRAPDPISTTTAVALKLAASL